MTAFVHRHLPLSGWRFRIVVGALALAALLSCVLLASAHLGRSLGVARLGVSDPLAQAGAGMTRSSAVSPGSRVEVIVQLRRGVPISQGRSLVHSLAGQPGPDLPIINGLSARLSARAARRLAASPLVHAVSLNAPIQESTQVNFDPQGLSTTFDQTIGATNVWNHSTGQGVGVAVIDTGISGGLPDFRTSQGSSTSRVVASAVEDTNATTAGDSFGHGTMVAGLIGGNGGYRDAGDQLWGKYAGTAPDANLISIKIGDDAGHATTLDAIYALQFSVDHRSAYKIKVVNLSFRSTSAQSYTTDPLDAAVEQAWFDGITVVAAAGNLGTAADAVSYAPGNDPYVITVGADNDQGTTSSADDVEASWSSHGVTQDGFQKPDVLAPGAHIVSTLAPNSGFATLCPACVIGGAYFQASGTSLAAPLVSGVVADLLAAHPTWTPAMVKGAIVNTAYQLPAGGSELWAMGAYGAMGSQLSADQALAPSQLIDPGTGAINYNTASWSAGSWGPAADPLTASWSTASWSCESCAPGTSDNVASTTASWSNVGWATFWG
jgi:serine protease AprX